jgi:hypothetical protein
MDDESAILDIFTDAQETQIPHTSLDNHLVIVLENFENEMKLLWGVKK